MARSFSKSVAPDATPWIKKKRDAASLDKWLADPEKFAPNSDMAFQLVRAEEQTDIIAYLKQLPSN
jgi:cytochrome c2